jgi:type IV secretion system protein TrbL
MSTNTRFLLLVTIALALLTVTQETAADLDFGVVLKQYENLSGAFGNFITTAARTLLLILITIDVIWTTLNQLLKGSGPNDILTYIAVRVVWYGFLALMISSNYLSLLVLGFKDLGENASGIAIVTPGAVFWKGVDLITIITTNFEAGATILGVPVPAGLAALTNPFVAFALGLSIILILLAFTIMTAQYIMILVQMYFYLSVAPLLISFGGLSHGRDLAMKALSSAIVIGVRLLAIYFVLAVANGMAPVIGAELAVSGIDNMSPIWAAVGLSALLAILAIKVPTLASDILSGSASLSGGDLFGTAAVGAAVGSAVTNGMSQVMEKLGLSGTGSISAAGAGAGGALNSPTDYMTAAQQFGNSSPAHVNASNGSAFGRGEVETGDIRPVVGENSGLTLNEMQTKHDQELGLTPDNRSGAGDNTSESANTSLNAKESTVGSTSQVSSYGNTGSATSAVLNGNLQRVLEDLAKDEQVPPASVHIPPPDEHH